MACPNVLPDLTAAEETRGSSAISKDAVLNVLHERSADWPLFEAVERVSSEFRVSRASIKAAIWELYADGFVELTPNWDLHLTEQTATLPKMA